MSPPPLGRRLGGAGPRAGLAAGGQVANAGQGQGQGGQGQAQDPGGTAGPRAGRRLSLGTVDNAAAAGQAEAQRPGRNPAAAADPVPPGARQQPMPGQPRDLPREQPREQTRALVPAPQPAAPRGGEGAKVRVAPPVGDARMRPRHYGVLALFLLIVVLPTLSYSWYLGTRAADQYESVLGFGSRTEEAASTFAFLGALTGSSQSGSKDMDILYQFVVSQELVSKIDAELDLREMWSRPLGDPLFAFNKTGTIEDLVAFWQRMVRVNYDNGTGLMTLSVHAFAPQDAQRIGEAVLRESTNIVNELSKTAQDDLTRYSKKMLDETQQKLADARLAVLDYQIRNNIVDPSNLVASQVTVVASLNKELADSQVELDLLTGSVPATDPRVAILQRKIDVINNRITIESAKVGASPGAGAPGVATLMAEFGKLQVEQDFAQQAYLSAMAAHDQAMADAQKKTRYLATYLEPTLAQASTAPNRPLQAAMAALAGFLLWSILVLGYYALRDRR